MLYSQNVYCQNSWDLIGIWQLWDSTVAAGYQDRYEFCKDNSFKYFTSDFADDNPLRAIFGIFELKKDTLLLSIKEFAYKNGYLRIGNSYLEDTSAWFIEHDTFYTVRCESHCIQKAHIIFDFTENKKKIGSININGLIFYRIEE